MVFLRIRGPPQVSLHMDLIPSLLLPLEFFQIFLLKLAFPPQASFLFWFLHQLMDPAFSQTFPPFPSGCLKLRVAAIFWTLNPPADVKGPSM